VCPPPAAQPIWPAAAAAAASGQGARVALRAALRRVVHGGPPAMASWRAASGLVLVLGLGWGWGWAGQPPALSLAPLRLAAGLGAHRHGPGETLQQLEQHLGPATSPTVRGRAGPTRNRRAVDRRAADAGTVRGRKGVQAIDVPVFGSFTQGWPVMKGLIVLARSLSRKCYSYVEAPGISRPAINKFRALHHPACVRLLLARRQH
jgi:hypothetical protein